MKRILPIFSAILLFSAALCIQASASDFDAAAEDLSVIGMFRGTANGFELDRVPTRSEAAIMLVRLYGAEETAKTAYAAGEISHPFTDVSAFTAPYVAWLYTNGITNGFTETIYASQRPCSAQNYVVFLLRALGYHDGTDFQYAEALSFARSKGFYDPVLFSGEFLRDDLAGLTYQALAADMANGKNCLLDSLIAGGAVDAKTAKPLRDKIKLYRTLTLAMKSIDKGAVDVVLSSKVDMTTCVAGETVTTYADVAGTMQMIASGTDIQLAYSTTAVNDGILTKSNLWMKDGWVYYEESGNILKYCPENPAAVFHRITPTGVGIPDISGLAAVDSITCKKSGSNSVYTLVINQHLGGLDSIVSSLDTAEFFGPINAVYTVDYSGRFTSVHMTYSTDLTMDMPLTDGFSEQLRVRCSYETAMKIKATGIAVKINWPDFSSAKIADNSSLPDWL